MFTVRMPPVVLDILRAPVVDTLSFFVPQVNLERAREELDQCQKEMSVLQADGFYGFISSRPVEGDQWSLHVDGWDTAEVS